MAEKEKRLPLLLYATILIVVGAAVLFAFLAVVLGIQPPEIPSFQFPGGSQLGENQPAENTAENAPPPVWPEKGGEFVPPGITPPSESLPAVGENEVLIRWFVAIGIRSTSWGGPIEGMTEFRVDNSVFPVNYTIGVPLPTYYDPNFRIGFNVKRRPLIPENVVINIYYENEIEFKNFVIKPENKIYSSEGELISKESARVLNAGEVVALLGDRKEAPVIEIRKSEIEDYFYTLNIQNDYSEFRFYLSNLYPREVLTVEGWAKLSREEAERILTDLTLRTGTFSGNIVSSVSMMIENKGTLDLSLKATIEKYVENICYLIIERWEGEEENHPTYIFNPMMTLK